MFIEPCCISRQLPPLLKEHHKVFFQTSGDCNVQKFMQAVSCLTESHSVFFLAIPTIDAPLLRTIDYYLHREWYDGFILLTQFDQSELVKESLSDFLPQVAYGASTQLHDGAFALFGKEVNLYLQGAMLLDNAFSLCPYAGYLGKDTATLRSALEGFFPKINLRPLLSPSGERVRRILKYQFL